jgi:hypothetical protein
MIFIRIYVAVLINPVRILDHSWYESLRKFDGAPDKLLNIWGHRTWKDHDAQYVGELGFSKNSTNIKL